MNDRLARAGIALGLLTAAAMVASPDPASARVSVGVGIGLPLFAPPPVVYAPPPYYYPPPPVVYTPPPPPPDYAPAPAAATAPPPQNCREYQTTAIINGRPQQTYGTACLQPDGTWRIVQ